MKYNIITLDENWYDVSEDEMMAIVDKLEDEGEEYELIELEDEQDCVEVDYDEDFVRYMYYRDKL